MVYLYKFCQSKRVILRETRFGGEQSAHHLQTDMNTALHTLYGWRGERRAGTFLYWSLTLPTLCDYCDTPSLPPSLLPSHQLHTLPPPLLTSHTPSLHPFSPLTHPPSTPPYQSHCQLISSLSNTLSNSHSKTHVHIPY